MRTLATGESIPEDLNAKLLFNLDKSGAGEYTIRTEEKLEDKLWLVVRAMKNESEKQSYELKKNDIVKLGRIQFRVKDLQTDTIQRNDPLDITQNEDIEEVRSVLTSPTEIEGTDGENGGVPQ